MVQHESPVTKRTAQAALKAGRLSQKQFQVLAWRHGWGGPPRTLEAIGQHYSVSRERVRQIYTKAVAKLGWRHARSGDFSTWVRVAPSPPRPKLDREAINREALKKMRIGAWVRRKREYPWWLSYEPRNILNIVRTPKPRILISGPGCGPLMQPHRFEVCGPPQG